MIKCLFPLLLLLTATTLSAQVSVNQDNSAPDPSAMLDVKSTDKGLLIPRMNAVQRSGISNPANGLLVFDNSTNSFWYFNGAGWIELTAGADNLGDHTATQNIQLNGNYLSGDGDNEGISVDADGRVGIGTAVPQENLHLTGNIRMDDGNQQAGNVMTSDENGTGSWQSLGSLVAPALTPDFSCMALSGSISVGNAPTWVEVSGNYAFVLEATSHTFSVFDISNPAAPTLAGSIVLGQYPLRFAMSGNYAYVIDDVSYDLMVVDVSNPASPALVGSLALGNEPYKVAVSGNYAYVTSFPSSGGLKVIDISNPGSPALVGSLNLGISAASVAASGSYVYLTDVTTDAFRVIDVSNPASPVQVAMLPTGDNHATFAVSGNYAYLPEITNGYFEVIDLSDPINPVLVANPEICAVPVSISVSGNYAYVVDKLTDDLKVVDVSNPGNPVVTGSLGIGPEPSSVAVSGNYAFVTDLTSGDLKVIKLSCALPLAYDPSTGGFINADTDDADADPTNELQSLGLSAGATLSISNGNSVNLSGINTDNQTLGLSGSTLSITNGNSVDISDNDWTLSGNNIYNANSGNVGIGTSSPAALLDIQGGALLVQGATGATPVSGAGTRLMWIPDKAAFRAGFVNGAQWDAGNIGSYSFVGGGQDNTASGIFSFTGGGGINTASGHLSFIGGGAQSTAPGLRSFVGGGLHNTTSGDNTFVGGGIDNIASGAQSFAGGGEGLLAKSFAETVFGNYNTDYTPVSATDFNTADRLFVIGNGTDSGNRSNAVTVLKSGNVGIGTASPATKLDVIGTVTATAFVGNGSALTGIDNQTLGLSGATLSISNGNNVDLAGINTDNQTLSLSGSNLSISNGNTIALPLSQTNTLKDADNDTKILVEASPDEDVIHAYVKNVEGLQLNQNGLFAPGTYNENGVAPVTGAGIRLMWVPARAALRVGEVTGTQWNSSNIGLHTSVLGGKNNFIPFGGSYGTIAGGTSNTVSGAGGFVGAGESNQASGEFAGIVGGLFNVASGNQSFIGTGQYNTASGQSSVVVGGEDNIAAGNMSTVGGNSNKAASYGETTLGLFATNYTPASTTAFNASDRLFAIGNGSDANARSNALTILKSGNVGIGTATPSAKLQVNGGNIALSSGNFTLSGGNIALGGGWLSNDGGNEGVYVATNGRVGIGTTSPEAMLHVVGTKVPATGSGNYFVYSFGNNAPTQDISVTNSVVGFFDGDVMASQSLISMGSIQWSDARAKRILRRSDSREDLDLLKRIQITDYQWIDQVEDHGRVNKKIIAQEVEQVLPDAVSRMRKAIPNVYAKAVKVDYDPATRALTVYLDKAHDFSAGDKVRMFTDQGDLDAAEVLSVPSPDIFTVSCEKAPASAFVYGKWVDDYRMVDYDAIAMLNVSATQELAKEVEVLRKRNAELEALLAEKTAAFEQRFQKLEASLQQLNYAADKSQVPNEK